jgi:inosine/xanthosine triphosphate pyrophosphatase family protein
MQVVFVTPNQSRLAEVQRLLADVDLTLSRFGPSVAPGLSLQETARARAQAAFATLGRPCFVENTAFELEGEAERRGAELKALLVDLGEDGFCRDFGGRHGVARVVVALADGEGVHLFEGATEGAIADHPRGPEVGESWGWDRVFVPEGFGRTLAELGASKYLVNMRHRPLLDLAEHLRGRKGGGLYEAHVTVRTAETARFSGACDELGVKCVLIELPAGVEPQQPMTATIHRGLLRDVQEEVHTLGRELVARGFEVTRTKIEALPRNGDIPESDEEALSQPAGYFEYHLKVLLPTADIGVQNRVRSAAESCGARLSRNANSKRKEGETRFITLRVPGVGRAAGEARFEALTAAVEPLGYPILARVREYTVYDSNVGVDRGWM